jgi:4,5:9,10-diseco-3-hydroxy-5,9,17-trioxoandrosta-1(10),2-diene-4-oate hydrolase
MSAIANQAKYLAVNGVQTRYFEAGKGEATILLHGGGPGASGISNYSKNLEVLAQGRRVIVPDLPGFGETEAKLPEGPTFHVMGDFVRQFMDTLKIEKASFVGNSMGGAAALMVALRAPERVNRLVLMGTGGSQALFTPMPTEGLQRMRNFFLAGEPTLERLQGVIDLLVFDPSSITPALLQERLKAASRPELLKNSIFHRPVAGDIWKENLAALNHRTLIVWGREDRVIPIDSSFILLKTMPNAQLHVFPKCGHWVQWEKADEFNALVSDFLDRA